GGDIGARTAEEMMDIFEALSSSSSQKSSRGKRAVVNEVSSGRDMMAHQIAELTEQMRLMNARTMQPAQTMAVDTCGAFGDVCIQTDIGCTITLKDVRHVPDLRLNLISVHALHLAGYTNNFGNGTWRLTKGSLLAARGTVRSTLYRTQLKENVLEMVYSDVCGPMEVESLGGSRYFVTFIDDASRKLWVYLLRTKGEVFQYFKRFHAMVERQAGKPLKCLRSDNGREYTSHEFKNYCAEHGIRHEKTVPGTPQHNDVAERINRTIMEKVRCMLRMAKLPKPFWGEAVLTACYLINRSPS
ncbi:Uncharacterized mitochondrial protein AtMg00710, partial [Striga hermonthica]